MSFDWKPQQQTFHISYNFSYQFRRERLNMVGKKERKINLKPMAQINKWKSFSSYGDNASILFSICHPSWYSISRHKNLNAYTCMKNAHTHIWLTQLPHLWRFHTHMYTFSHPVTLLFSVWFEKFGFHLNGNQIRWICSKTTNAVILIVPSSTTVAHQ